MNQGAPILPDRLADFSDRLSPMLVKELRQGLRTKVFTSVFIVIQAVMVFISILSTNEASLGQDTSDMTEFFWAIFTFALLVVLPLRGFSALANEIQNGALETVILTHLTAWKIVYGKWLALFSQTLLISLSIVPYVILSYFLGNVNLIDEVIRLIGLLFLSGLITAIVVGVSSQKIMFLRLAMIGMPLFFGFMIAEENGMDRYLHSIGPSLFTDGLWAVILALCIGTVFGTYYALDMGATYIASEATNYSTRKRLIGVSTVMVLFSLMWWTGPDEYIPFGVAMLVLALIAFDALAEKATLIPSVYAPFLKRGGLGRTMALFLAPGWTHGTFFVLICLSIAAIGVVTVNGSRLGEAEVEGNALLLTAAASLILPSALISFVRPERRTMALYNAVILGLLAVSVVIVASTLTSSRNSLWISVTPIGAYAIFADAHDVVVAADAHDMVVDSSYRANKFKIALAFGMLIITCVISFIVLGVQGLLHYRRACRAYSKVKDRSRSPQGSEVDGERSSHLEILKPGANERGKATS